MNVAGSVIVVVDGIGNEIGDGRVIDPVMVGRGTIILEAEGVLTGVTEG